MKQNLVSLTCVLLYVTSALAVQKCKKVVDIAMILDESGSIGRRDFQKIKTFVVDVISRFSVDPFGAHFAAVTYSTYPHKVFSLTKYTNASQLKTAVRNLNYRGGWTKTGKALKLVQQSIFGQQEDRKNVTNVVVLFSDGESQDHSTAVSVAREMKDNGVEILCIGIGNGLTVERLMAQLKQISSKPEYTFRTTVNALNTIEDSLVKDMCEATSCPAVSFSKKGCYKIPSPTPADPKLLFNHRNDVDWFAGWPNYIETVVCDCGKKAMAMDGGYKYFCIEHFGRCWGYKNLDVLKHAGASKCWGKHKTTCIHDQKNPVCVGTKGHGYVYELN